MRIVKVVGKSRPMPSPKGAVKQDQWDPEHMGINNFFVCTPLENGLLNLTFHCMPRMLTADRLRSRGRWGW